MNDCSLYEAYRLTRRMNVKWAAFVHFDLLQLCLLSQLHLNMHLPPLHCFSLLWTSWLPLLLTEVDARWSAGVWVHEECAVGCLHVRGELHWHLIDTSVKGMETPDKLFKETETDIHTAEQIISHYVSSWEFMMSDVAAQWLNNFI